MPLANNNSKMGSRISFTPRNNTPKQCHDGKTICLSATLWKRGGTKTFPLIERKKNPNGKRTVRCLFVSGERTKNEQKRKKNKKKIAWNGEIKLCARVPSYSRFSRGTENLLHKTRSALNNGY